MKVIEEIAELTHAICKAEKFGYDNFHPFTKTLNSTQIKEEISHVRKAIFEYENNMRWE